MTHHQQDIADLSEKLALLLERQADFSREIEGLRLEIDRLKAATAAPAQRPAQQTAAPAQAAQARPVVPPAVPQAVAAPPSAPVLPKKKSDLEAFIGEDLISKVGIGILVIGVGIGAKYAIDRELISPVARILLGYLAGILLLVFGARLRARYEGFSAVLVSGAMAILYIVTYFAYSAFQLMPQALAFGLMVLITAGTVAAAISYNRQVIAHVGAVGAYAVPFLLGSGAGQAGVLFGYMTIINAGILVIAFRRYWKLLHYSSFGITWLIFVVWYIFSYDADVHFVLALVFASVFFSIFYLNTLAYKLLRDEALDLSGLVILLANAFLFYALGHSILAGSSQGGEWLGAFALGNAALHFAVSALVRQRALADKNLFYLAMGLGWVFVAIAIPVQLDGNWVTLLWAGQAALLFWIGRVKGVPFYEKLSYPVMLIAFMGLLSDWATAYGGYMPYAPETRIPLLLNLHLLSSLLFAGCFAFINGWHGRTERPSREAVPQWLSEVMGIAMPAILIIAVYGAFRMEIATYWEQLFTDSSITVGQGDQQRHYQDYDCERFKAIWLINYSLLFFSALSAFNARVLKSTQIGIASLALVVCLIVAFLSNGLYELAALRQSYVTQDLAEHYPRGAFHLGIRYVSYLCVALALGACWQHLRRTAGQVSLRIAFDALLHIALLAIASQELIHWMELARSSQSDKLGLSILWGVYALVLIALGIWGRKKHLRLGAIALFALTLAKLFLYDIPELDTIAKIIVFVSLGVLLLVISFLYNKYKHVIAGDAPN